MRVAKLRPLALTWLLSLGVSALLVVAGQRWPQPLPIRSAWVWAGLVVLPLVTLVAVVARWSVPEGSEEGESSEAMQER